MMMGRSFQRRKIAEAVVQAFGGEEGTSGQKRRVYSAKAKPGEKRLTPTLSDLLNSGRFGAS